MIIYDMNNAFLKYCLKQMLALNFSLPFCSFFGHYCVLQRTQVISRDTSTFDNSFFLLLITFRLQLMLWFDDLIIRSFGSRFIMCIAFLWSFCIDCKKSNKLSQLIRNMLLSNYRIGFYIETCMMIYGNMTQFGKYFWFC